MQPSTSRKVQQTSTAKSERSKKRSGSVSARSKKINAANNYKVFSERIQNKEEKTIGMLMILRRSSEEN
jgi:hypothetical protein